MAEPTSIESADQLAKLASKHKYVVVDFWADWCPPCKAISPMFANLSKTHGVPDALAFCKVNVDNTPDIAQKYGITAMPSFLFLVDGKPDGVDLGSGKEWGRSVVLKDDKVTLIRGADPKNLNLVVTELNRLVAKPDAVAEETKNTPPEAVATASEQVSELARLKPNNRWGWDGRSKREIPQTAMLIDTIPRLLRR
jgi:thioredoxin 1